MAMHDLDAFKVAQREGWVHFAPLAAITAMTAPRLVRHAGIRPGDRVLDVACGTGVVAVTAARLGAHVTGLDLTPELLAIARDNARIADVEIEFLEGDCETIDFEDAAFDVIVSQYGHMFAPRPEVAIAEMLRVLKKDGTIAFSTWPPELYVGRLVELVARYMPVPLPPGVPPPTLWGDPDIVRERLGPAVRDILFDRDIMIVPALSPQHNRETTERTAGPVVKIVEMLRSEPQKLETFRQELDAIVRDYFVDNTIRQGYLLTRATKN